MAIKNTTNNYVSKLSGKEDIDSITLKGSLTKGTTKRRNTIRPYPSQALCQRKMVFESDCDGLETESDITFSLYTQFGVVAEKYLKQSWQNAGNLLLSSYKIPENVLDIGGEIDAVMKINDVIRVIEVKTTDELPAQPKSDHYVQALTYSALTGLPFTIYYLSRNIVEYKNGTKKLKSIQFDYDYDPDNAYAQIMQMAKANVFGKAGFVPPIPAHLTAKSHCGFCRFVDICWNKADLSKDNFSVVYPDMKTEIELEIEALKITEKFMSKKEVEKRNKNLLKYIKEKNNGN